MTNPLTEKLQDQGYTEPEDDMLFRYADWWWESNCRLAETTEALFEIFQNSFGYLQYLDRGYVILED